MEEMRRQTRTPWIPSRTLGKSPTNKLILNTHLMPSLLLTAIGKSRVMINTPVRLIQRVPPREACSGCDRRSHSIGFCIGL